MSNVQALDFGAGDEENSWEPIDLETVLEAGPMTPDPRVFRTLDGHDALFYRESINGLHGDSGIGKSWLALAAVAQTLAAGLRAMIVDYEANADETTARLLDLGATPDQLTTQLLYIHPTHPTGDSAVTVLLDYLQMSDEMPVDLVIIDSLGEAFALDGIDENSDADVGPWLRRFARPLAEAGPAVVLIDHATKGGGHPLHPSGSKRKRAAISGASYLVTTSTPPTRHQAGTLTLTCAKDRHGTHQPGKVTARADITPQPDGTITVHLHTPDPATIPPGTVDDQVDLIARSIVHHAKTANRPLTRAQIEAAVIIKARSQTKRAAIDHAVALGALSDQTGPRGARLHSYIRDIEKPTQ